MGLTEHVVQRALQSGIGLQELGRVLVEATVADGESGVLGPMDGWFATANAIYRISPGRVRRSAVLRFAKVTASRLAGSDE